MEGLLRSSLVAALLFLTLAALAAASSGGGGGDDDAAAAELEEHAPADDEPYMLVSFLNKDGEEIRLLSDKGSETLSASGFANRSGHWFYAIREGKAAGGSGSKRRRRLPLLHSASNNSNNMSRGDSRAEGFWNTLAVPLASNSGPVAADDDGECYVIVGMETSGGHKIRFAVVADQSYFFITGFAHGLLTTSGGHAEVVASNVLAAMMKDGM